MILGNFDSSRKVALHIRSRCRLSSSATLGDAPGRFVGTDTPRTPHGRQHSLPWLQGKRLGDRPDVLQGRFSGDSFSFGLSRHHADHLQTRCPTSGKDALGVSLLAGLLATVDEVIEGIVRCPSVAHSSPRRCDGTSAVGESRHRIPSASVGQPTEPCLGRRCKAHCSRTTSNLCRVGSVRGITQCLHFPFPGHRFGAAPVQEPVTESLEPARWKFPSQASRSSRLGRVLINPLR